MSDNIEAVINGKRQSLPEGTTIAALLRSLALDPESVAVECNGRIVKRAEWERSALAAGSSLEIVQFVGGG